ncbi:ArnT family glycosyltransferase [Bacteroidota bacterium]
MKIIKDFRNYIQEINDTKIISDRVALLFVIIIIFCCALIRIFTFNNLPLEITLWKEIDYLNISKSFFEHGFNILKPEVPWLADPPRVTSMELPLIPYLSSLLYALFGYNIYTARFMPMLAYLGIIFFVFKLAQRELGNLTAVLAALASAIMPLYHPFGQILFSEPWLIAFSLFTIYQFAEWLDKEKRSNAIMAVVGFSLTIALKVTAMYILIPIVWILYRRYKFNIKGYYKYILLGLIAMILPVAWYAYAYYLTYHSVDVFGIYRGHNKFQTLTMLSDLFWYKTMYYRLSGGILGGKIGLFLCVIGFLAAFLIRRTHLFYAYLIAIIAFFIIVAEGQIDAPYRQLTIIPVFSVFVAIGAISIIAGLGFIIGKVMNSKFKPNPILVLSVAVILIMIMPLTKYRFVFSKQEVADKQRYELAMAIKKNKAENTKIITAGEYTIHVGGYDMSPTIYYYADVQGWSLRNTDWNMNVIDSLINKGATLFTAVDMSREPESLPFIKQLEEIYPTLYKNEEEELLLLDLKKQINP